ncbi:unknown (plasmid) [Haloarcula marismortui ATCC 43049]|uniref:Uncharacterized protein n=1 Tax=Haloarcula marismortui (strain ATCC 43049 / DSM 3752 / JCM 8966 / VKM B-1809) TaxID=272569 RepID=Q5V789_HALMA|nr:unknown [Haloarcula marismortui ATCC 43049]
MLFPSRTANLLGIWNPEVFFPTMNSVGLWFVKQLTTGTTLVDIVGPGLTDIPRCHSRRDRLRSLTPLNVPVAENRPLTDRYSGDLGGLALGEIHPANEVVDRLLGRGLEDEPPLVGIPEQVAFGAPILEVHRVTPTRDESQPEGR